jgi:hypothetical protein
MHIGESYERKVYSIEHQLNAHKYHDSISAGEYANSSNGEHSSGHCQVQKGVYLQQFHA